MDTNLIVTSVQQHFLQKGTYLSTIFVELDGDDIEVVMVLPQLDLSTSLTKQVIPGILEG